MKYRNFLRQILYFLFCYPFVALAKKNWQALLFFLIFAMTLAPQKSLLAENVPKLLHDFARGQPEKAQMVKYVWQQFGEISEHYGQKQGIAALEALYVDPAAAVYAMEMFPGYFKKISQELGAKEATYLIKATLYSPEILDEISKQMKNYCRDKPRLLGFNIRNHPQAKKHLFTDLEAQSAFLPSRFISAYTQARPAVRRAIVQHPDSAFFLLETGEKGLQTIEFYGSDVIEVASFYQPGHRKEVIATLREAGSAVMAAFSEASIVGWRTAARFPRLYQNLANMLGVEEAIEFLNTNSYYIASQLEDPTNSNWIYSLSFQVDALRREGTLSYLKMDPFSLALCMEVKGGKQLVGKMGKYLPASLLYQHYPRHKVFLTRFLNRYGVAPLQALYEFSQQRRNRKVLAEIIDECGERGLLLITYTHNRHEMAETLIQEGFDRGEAFLENFHFNEYGIPSRKEGGQHNNVPDLVKVSLNYFYYGTEPTWAEIGLATLDVVELLELSMTWGSSPLINQGGRLIFGEAISGVFKQYGKAQMKKFAYERIMDVAKKIAWRTIKKVMRKELLLQKIGSLEPIDHISIGKRVGVDFVKTSVEKTYQVALAEFLSWQLGY